MNLSRRQFAILAAAVAAGCARGSEASSAAAAAGTSQPSTRSSAIDAGAISDFNTDDVYDAFRDQGFFVIRRERQLFALSSVCTHKGCKVRVQEDLSFLCKCHSSRFDKDGNVTKGPATRALPRLAVATDENGHLFVDPAQHVTPSKSSM